MATLLWSKNTNSCAPIAMAYLNTLSVETTRISSRLHPLYFIQSPSPCLNCNLEAKSPTANRPTRLSGVNSVLRDSPAHNISSLGSPGLHCGLTVVAVVEVVLGGLDSFGFGCFVQFPLGTHLKWQQPRVTSYVAWSGDVVSPRNDVWRTRGEIPYWWRITTQIWVVLLNRNQCGISPLDPIDSILLIPTSFNFVVQQSLQTI